MKLKLIIISLILIFVIIVVLLFLTYNKSNLDCEKFSDINSSEITSCGIISSSGVYLLKQDICSFKNCIIINADNIKLDCQNHTIFGGGGPGRGEGITSKGRQITIKNCVIDGFSNGIYLVNSKDSLITNNTVTDSFLDGIALWSSSNSNNITENTLKENGGSGIGVYDSSSSNIILDNYVYGKLTINPSDSGIMLGHAKNNQLSRNTIMENVNGIRLASSDNNSISGNVLTGNVMGIFTQELTSNNSIENNKICSNRDWDLKCDQRADILDKGNNTCTEEKIYNCPIDCVPCGS